MTVRAIFRRQRGEPIVIARRVLSGDPSGYTVSAVLKKCNGQVVPGPEVAVAAEFEVEFEPATGDEPARWSLIVGAEITAGLHPGQYCADAKFELDGEVVEITDPCFIIIDQSVSG